MSFIDYYAVLGVARDALQDDIKTEFRKLVLKFHPDRGNGDREKFHQITEAYNVLSNPEKRRQYDLSFAGIMITHPEKDVKAIWKKMRKGGVNGKKS